ncbi:MAG: helix-turn-helix transcriptional regulator, partial [Pseudonocardia sp.]|nr:helix-turn-helix transcriptional regulator [Pseudonocardia sp.]
MRRARLRRGVTQAQAAARVEVSRPTLTQWESGRYLPSPARAQKLDDLLGAGGELYRLAERSRPAGAYSVPAISPAAGHIAPTNHFPAPVGDFRTVLQIFTQVGDALVRHLRRDAEGTPLGWAHNLQQDDRSVTSMSTAYGIKILLMLGGPHVDLATVARGLGRFRIPGPAGMDGWASASQSAARPEATAVVVDALSRVGVLSPGAALTMLEGLIDDATRHQTFVLTTVLETVLRIAPDSDLAHDLLGYLLAARRPFDGQLVWPEKVGDAQAKLTASTAHTARAVVVLQSAVRSIDRAELRDALYAGQEWLAGTWDDEGVSEVISREIEDDRPGGAREELSIRHFTAAWVVRALAGVERPDTSRLGAALARVWTWFDPGSGLWGWGNGDLPVWMTHDSVAAVRAAALALTPSAVPSPRSAPSLPEDNPD